MSARAGPWLREFLILFVFWLLFVNSTEWQELAVGAAAAALAATGAEAARGLKLSRFRPGLGVLAQARRVPAMVLMDCWVLLRATTGRLLGRRAIEGELRTARFEAGGDDAASATRRALAVLLATSSPNSLVIQIDRRERLMLFHQAVPRKLPQLIRELGALQ